MAFPLPQLNDVPLEDHRRMKSLVRYGLPAAVILAGFVALFIDGSAAALLGWAMIVAFTIKIVFLSEVFRVGLSGGNKDREDEDDARRFLTEHGRWPDEPACVTRSHRAA